MGWYEKFKGLIQSNLKIVIRPKVTTPVRPGVIPKVVVVPPPANSKITYMMNDITTPDLIKEVNVPPTPVGPKFTVTGYKGGGYALNTIQGQAATVYVTIANTINNVNQLAEKKLLRWAAIVSLAVIPRAGRMLNAFYNRKTLSFFYYTDREKNTDFFSADSADVVSHELGHAILDSYRPDLWNVASMEIWAFHESFGDLISMLSIMANDEVLNYVNQTTGGDLRKFNAISNIAEDFGRVAAQYGSSREKRWLRSAINDFVYIAPETLPTNGPDTILTNEPHNFSRVMTATFYDLWLYYYDYFRLQGVESIQAMREARNTLGKYALESIRLTPNRSAFFSGMATTMLFIDVRYGSVHHDRMHRIFVNRGILGEFSALNHVDTENHACHEVRLCECGPISAQAHNPLYELKIDVPAKDEDTIIAAKIAVDFLHQKGKVSDERNTPFEISNGKLTRSHFSCDCS